MSPAELISMLRASTDALTDSMRGLTDDDIRAPSRLPGWSRGHLITHLARNADAIRRLMLAARSGEPISMYSSRPSRDAEIEVGAQREPGLIVEEADLAFRAFAADAAAMTEDDWAGTFGVAVGGVGEPVDVPAVSAVDMRLREVEIHHVDLGVGHDFSSTPPETLDRMIGYAADRMGSDDQGVISLSAADLGRSYSVNGAAAEPVAIDADGATLLRYLTGRALDTDDFSAHPELSGWG